MITPLRRRALSVCAALLFAPAVLALEPFKVNNIRTEGLQRLDEGTVLTYLPLTVGDEINDATSRAAMRSLYASGLFNDVQLLRDGDALVVKLEERPQITKFEMDGNEKIGGDELKKSLKDLGLAEGEVFKRALLDQVQQELRRQYFANGYYDVLIEPTVTELPNNRVEVKIKVTEGDPTTIADINILGATAFPVDDLLEQIDLKPSQWWNFLQKTDRYSKQSLGGDLEKLQNYYQDRGYLRFQIESVQVALSPDKKRIYITINVDEGDKYKVKDYRISGETVLSQDYLKLLVSTKPGALFSRKEATESGIRMESALSDVGFAFAKVTPVPEPVDDSTEVNLNYVIEPGKRTYVRRISFAGHGSTHDETLRREMRQLEAAPFSKSGIERSRIRLTRLPFIEEAEVETKPVAGSDDLVDIAFKVKERAPGSVQFGVGFSGTQGFLVNASLQHTNFLGTGNRVDLTIDNSNFSRQFNFAWTDPYFTEDGISQSVAAYYRKTSSVIRFSAGFNTNTIGADLTYGFPLSEFTTMRAGAGVAQTAIDATPGSSTELLSFVTRNGAQYTNFTLRTGITRDTRNKTFFATRGGLTRFNIDLTTPGSDLQYFNASFQQQQFQPLPFGFLLAFDGSIGYLDSYGKTESPPPFENYFAGGARTVRGYRDGSLGPLDSTGFFYGGSLRTTAQTDLVIPIPIESDGKSTRFSLFYDAGYAFAKPTDFTFGDLRQSAGVSVQWFTPFLGLLQLSYAVPLNAQVNDRKDRFQINFGGAF